MLMCLNHARAFNSFMTEAVLCKSMDWFLYDNGLRHKKFKDERAWILLLECNQLRVLQIIVTLKRLAFPWKLRFMMRIKCITPSFNLFSQFHIFISMTGNVKNIWHRQFVRKNEYSAKKMIKVYSQR